MSCHGGLRGDQTWEKHSNLGRFLAIHPVNEIVIKKSTSAFSGVSGFYVEARCGMHIAGSDAYSQTPEEAIRQAVLKVRSLTGHPEEYDSVTTECLVCSKMRRPV